MADGGGGGDGGAAQRERQEQVRRSDAIDRINAYFGMDPSSKTIKQYVSDGAPVDTSDVNMFGQPNLRMVATPAAPSRTYAMPGDRGGPGASGGVNTFSVAPAQGSGIDGRGGSVMVPAATRDVANPLLSEAEKNKIGRAALYDDTRANVLDLNLKKLSDMAEVAGRDRKFALARRGLSRGSVDIDSGAAFKKAYDQGATQASQQADQAKLDFRTSDEQSRLNLINQINAGGDANTSVQSGINALQLNSDAARAGAAAHTINNTFGDLATQYAYGQDLSGRQAAANRYMRNRTLVPSNTSDNGSIS